MSRSLADDPDLLTVVTRLQAEAQDQIHKATDLEDLVDDVLMADGEVNPEALGFALRDQFTSLRRFLAWERDVLMPLGARRLSEPAIGQIKADQSARLAAG